MHEPTRAGQRLGAIDRLKHRTQSTRLTDSGILHQLRSATQSAHTRLEQNVRIEERISDPERYAELLEKFLGWHEPMEGLLRGVPGWKSHGIDLEARSKTDWLKRDLVALGRSDEYVRTLPRCDALPRVSSLSRGFGCAYVIEGSTLGGRHIAAMLQGSAIPEGARTFFRSYGPAVGEKWKEFITSLDAFAAADGDRAEILKGANSAFASMDEWICGVAAGRQQ
jgi:heme oxygenase